MENCRLSSLKPRHRVIGCACKGEALHCLAPLGKPTLVPSITVLMLPIDEAVDTADGFSLVEFTYGNKTHKVSVWPPEEGEGPSQGYVYLLGEAEFSTREELMQAPLGGLSFDQIAGPFKEIEANGCYLAEFAPFAPYIKP